MNSKQVLFFCISLCAVAGYSQNTSGKVYAGEKRVPGVLVENRTQNKSTVTTDEGDFSLAARLKDSLVFSAPFMETQVFIVEPYQLEKRWVVELKENLNELEEVRLTEAPKVREFNLKEYDSIVNAAIQADVKKYPHLYKPPNYTNGMDFIAIGKMFLSLFKKDPSKQKKEYNPITYEQLHVLFATSDYFDRKFLNRQLEIESYHQNLFFEYLDAKQLKGELLLPEHQLDLLDRLMVLSTSFKTELKNFEQEGVSIPEKN
ncbi:hypothetical protein [Leeuwenhoekiella sp. NPDC079379]|uniref:hypothetical protein n=1 Tax=Leeuwenhoekiella sp. NPDC079379 TaxID=3364122 RepID=UPI0037C9F5FF